MKPTELYTYELDNLEKKLSGRANQHASNKYEDMPRKLIEAKIEFLVRKASELLKQRKINN